MRHTLSVLVENQFGVLARIAGMFSGRGFNIDTLNVAPTHDSTLSRITVVVRGDDTVLDQLTKQLRKLVNVIEVRDFNNTESVDRELVLIKLGVEAKSRAELIQICDIFRAKIVNVSSESMIIEITGDNGKINAFLGLLDSYEVQDLARTGKLALSR